MTCSLFRYSIQITLSKPIGQKLTEGEEGIFVFVFDEIYLEGVGIAEFRHDLTAHAAGGTLAVGGIICAARNGDGFKFGLALADSLEKCDTLGAHRW